MLYFELLFLVNVVCCAFLLVNAFTIEFKMPVEKKDTSKIRELYTPDIRKAA